LYDISDINRDYLISLPVTFQTESGFQIVNLSSWDNDTLSYEFDNRWQEFSQCISNILSVTVRQPQSAKYIILDVDKWKCPYHDWCGGEVYDSCIILSENLVFLEHEWLHWIYDLSEAEINQLKGICGVS
jgi:hypothetical protein